jgi:hypothetical protein
MKAPTEGMPNPPLSAIHLGMSSANDLILVLYDRLKARHCAREVQAKEYECSRLGRRDVGGDLYDQCSTSALEKLA